MENTCKIIFELDDAEAAILYSTVKQLPSQIKAMIQDETFINSPEMLKTTSACEKLAAAIKAVNPESCKKLDLAMAAMNITNAENPEISKEMGKGIITFAENAEEHMNNMEEINKENILVKPD